MTGFGGLEISHDHRVLAPRPWTIEQSLWAADLARRARRPILELFAGVGHIGLVAARASGLPLTQVEIDPIACAFAHRNAARARLLDRVSICCGEVPSAIPAGSRYGVVIIDPPYVPSDRVAEHPADPTRTIDGGPDGLELAEAALRTVAERHPDTDVVLQLGSWEQGDVLGDRLGDEVRLVRARGVREDRLLLHLVTRSPEAARGDGRAALAGWTR